MDGAEAVNHRGGMNADDSPRCPTPLKDFNGALIIRVAEDWNNDSRITDIEIGVAGGKPRVAVAAVPGHWELHNIQAEANQPLVALFKNFVIFVGRIIFNRTDDGILADEPGDVIDMAVRVVAGNALSEPEDGRHVEKFPQIFFCGMRSSAMRSSYLLPHALKIHFTIASCRDWR